MSTIATLVTAARYRLDELSAHEWDDDNQLIPYINKAEIWVGELIGKLPGCGLFKYRDTSSLTAGTTTIALSSLTKAFAEMRRIELQHDGTYWVNLAQMDEEDESRLRNAAISISGDVIPKWRLFDTNIEFLPALSTTRTVGISYRWVPAVKTSGTIETPALEDDLIVLRAAHFAMADRRETNSAFDVEYGSRIAETIDRYSGRQFGARGERVRTRVTSRFYG